MTPSEQRESALNEANRIRAYRSETKRWLKSANTMGAVLSVKSRVMEPWMEDMTWRVRDLMLAVPHFGPRKVDAILAKSGVPPTKTIGKLTTRQRNALCEVLAKWEAQ